MYFDSIEAALVMDGHGAFVWSAYAITLIMLALILVLPVRRRRHLLAQLEDQLRREAAEAGQHSTVESGSTEKEAPNAS